MTKYRILSNGNKSAYRVQKYGTFGWVWITDGASFSSTPRNFVSLQAAEKWIEEQKANNKWRVCKEVE